MADAPQVAQSQAGGDSSSNRGRGGRGGRGGRPYRGGRYRQRRAGRGDNNGNTTPGESAQPSAQPAAATAALPPDAVPRPAPQSRAEPLNETPQDTARDGSQSGRSRGDRAGRGGRGGRGGPRRGRGNSNQRSVVVSHRARPGPQSQPPPQAADGLSPMANEFVPGQPVGAVQNTAPPAPRSKPKPKPQPVPRKATKSTAEDLPTRIHEDIDNGQYECVICTGEVVRTSRVWSCNICWTVAHLHCVRKWHTNQMKKAEEDRQNQNQNGETQQPTWRCPGCNSSLVDAPGPHRCWCGKDTDPRPIPGLPPHTCGQTCNKTRATCPHPCSLMCHAGPCPPCTLMGPEQTCYCGKHTLTRRCIETDYGKGFSCGEICGDLLPCGEHECRQPCHSGLCGACKVTVLATCYCGKEQRNMPCEQRDEILESFNYGQVKSSEDPAEEWFEGSFDCKKVCGRPLDCGHHACQKQCHAQDEAPAHCPLSPDVVTTCPCGKTPIAKLITEPRQSCQDPIPHCKEVCNKTLPCGHSCPQKCHDGPCPDCEQMVEVPCRCGRTTQELICHEATQEQPECTRVCRVQRNCGRHECGKTCCTGEKKAAERKKQQKRSGGTASNGNNNANNPDNFEAEHICLQVCGRQLKCGRHTCQQMCHRGPCASCPEAIFDEISCSCGRTVLQPPQPCGTRPPECRFPCTKARECGHPAVSHQCHPDEVPCPKCPFLVEKACICGKKTLKNQPCWFDEVRCGLPCGRKLKCGAHECKKTCHRPGECEDASTTGMSHCSQPCGRVRKSCEHTCQETCHAPLPCKEDKPCPSKTFITCPCQNRKQEVRCLATRLNPRNGDNYTPTQLKCDDECLRLQRNRRLADALNIDPETHTDAHIPYSDTTLKLYRENIPWAQSQEREFRVFTSPAEEGTKRLRFKPMPAHQRAFIHSLAEDYGLDSESQDPEPHRHVCIFKTPRFVAAPKKTLGQCVSLKLASGSSSAATAGGKTAASMLNAAERQKALLQQAPQPLPYNALLLGGPRFGLTIDEVEEGLAPELKKGSHSSVKVGLMTVKVEFVTRYLTGSDEVVVIAVPVSPAPTSAAGGVGPSPQDKAIETMLTNLRPTIAKIVTRLGLASKEVILCRVENPSAAAPTITRRQGDGPGASDKAPTLAGGWSAVASRGSWKRSSAQNEKGLGAQGKGSTGAPSFASAIAAGGAAGGVVNLKGRGAVSSAPPTPPGRNFVALLKKKERKPVVAEPVEEDWLVAAEKEDREQNASDGTGGGNGSGGEDVGDGRDDGRNVEKSDWAEESASSGGGSQIGEGSGPGEAGGSEIDESTVVEGGDNNTVPDRAEEGGAVGGGAHDVVKDSHVEGGNDELEHDESVSAPSASAPAAVSPAP